MSNLVAVRLHGPLGETYGRDHEFAIRSPREAIAALEANYPTFRSSPPSSPASGCSA